MAKEFIQNVIGIEISEETIRIAEINLIENYPTISKIKETTLPPRTILEGQIADPETITDTINTLLQEEFNSNRLVAESEKLLFNEKARNKQLTSIQFFLKELKNGRDIRIFRKSAGPGRQRSSSSSSPKRSRTGHHLR